MRLTTSQVMALTIDLGKLLTAATVFLPTVMWRQFQLRKVATVGVRRRRLKTSSGHTTSAPEPAAEPSALALIHDVLGGEVIAVEGGHRSPIRWRDDGIPAIGDDPACGPAA